jgi:hypothetical protein
MTLIPNWRRAWRMASVQIAGVAVVFGSLPPAAQAAVLDLVGVPASRVPAILGLLFLAGRMVAQPKASE